MNTENTLVLNTAVTHLFEKKVDRVNRKAAKLGMAPVSYTLGETFEKKVDADTIGSYLKVDEKTGKKVRVALYTEVALEGEAPVIEGYQFIATVDLRGNTPMVKRHPAAPKDIDLTEFFNNDGHCDHCGWNRNRHDVLILRNTETGELIQIGRSCAADFFRSKDASAMVAVSDWIEAYGNVTETSSRAEPATSVLRMFEVAAAVVRKFGWVSSKAVWEDDSLIPTRGRVWANLFPWPKMRAEDRVKVTDEDREEAKVVMDWLRRRFLDKPLEDCNEFERNVKAAVEGTETMPLVRDKNLNYLIWGIAGYKRDLQKEAEERRRRMEKAKLIAESEWVGTLKKREDFTATLQSKRGFGTQFGVKYLLNFRDDDGNVIVWWGTNDTAARMVVGNTYTIKATVTKHDEYRGVKQTTVSRAALVKGELEEMA
jgi:hypothetical protein